MTKQRYRAATVVIAATTTVMLLASCTSDGSGKKTDPPSRTATVTSPSSTPTPAPTTTAPKAPDVVAREQAVALVRKYYTVIDDAHNNPKTAKALNTVTMDEELSAQIRSLNIHLRMGGKSGGRVKVVNVTPGFVNLSYKPNANPRVLPTVTVTTCIDLRGITYVDAKGHSLIPPDRAPFYIETLTVQNFDPPKPSTWRVAVDRNKGASSCAGT
jgi:hypothetical protein